MKKYNWVLQNPRGTVLMSVRKPMVGNEIFGWTYSGNDHDFTVVNSGRRNHDWRKSLIDLSKNDYIIKDGILMATRKHAALIHAWADGALIQYQDPIIGWCDYEDGETPRFTENINLRIKPTTKTVKFRNYVINGQVRAYTQGSSMPNPDEYEWIDKDWREVEIEL